MRDNPYHSSKSEFVREPSPLQIYWKPVLIGFGIGFLGSIFLAIVWAVIGFVLAISLGDTIIAIYDSPIASLLGWCVGLVPFLVGLIYTCKLIPDSHVLNCIITAILSISVSLPFMFLGEEPLDWLVIGYHVLQLVMAMVVGLCWPRNAYR